jgi:MFS family permease
MNPASPPAARLSIRVLWLVGLLHGLNHLYNVALLPVYLQLQRDLDLPSVAAATSLTTVMMLAYFLPSYPLGVLADRLDRRRLLTWGLVLNALGYLGLGWARSYPMALGCVVLAGLGGSFYHPAATALVVRLFPQRTGRALGLIGIGASAGFFLGPLYVGWRAASVGWRAPLAELGVAGLVAAVLFAWLAPPAPATGESATGESIRPVVHGALFASPALWGWFLAAAALFSLRDFAACSMASLGSLFLQQAHGMDVRTTGLALSSIFLVGVVSNPLFGHLSDRARLRWIALVLVSAALVIAVFPRLPRVGLIPALLVYGFFMLANYPMVEAALLTSIPDAVRGRVFGLFITVSGLLGNLGHWWAGVQVKSLGEAAGRPESYQGTYLGLACLVLLSLAALPCLHALRREEGLAP